MGDTLGSAWTPPEGVTRHAGTPIPPELDFFAPPPLEIGQVISADSTLNVNQQATPPSKRIFKSVMVAVITIVITGVILNLLGSANSVVLIIAGAIAAVITYTCQGFNHSCTYVGERGIAEIQLTGSRDKPTQLKLLLFKAAANLYTGQTRRYRNGVYNGTSYSYQWTRPGEKPFELRGQYFNEKGWPEDRNLWHFANSAESAWSKYLLDAINDQFGRLGYVEFPTTGNLKAIRIGRGFLEFIVKDGTSQQVAVSDMRNIQLKAGQFYFTHQDARWWSGKGKYSFTYSTIPNAQLFLICLKSLGGVTF